MVYVPVLPVFVVDTVYFKVAASNVMNEGRLVLVDLSDRYSTIGGFTHEPPTVNAGIVNTKSVPATAYTLPPGVDLVRVMVEPAAQKRLLFIVVSLSFTIY